MLYKTVLEIIGNKIQVLSAGDFNQPDIDWISGTSKIPIHYRGDLILISEQGMIQNLCQSAPVGKSHHQVLLFDFVCNAQLSYGDDNTEKYNYSKVDFGKMRQVINDFDLATGAYSFSKTEMGFYLCAV